MIFKPECYEANVNLGKEFAKALISPNKVFLNTVINVIIGDEAGYLHVDVEVDDSVDTRDRNGID